MFSFSKSREKISILVLEKGNRNGERNKVGERETKNDSYTYSDDTWRALEAGGFFKSFEITTGMSH